jgi:hypothetical protein
VQWSFTTLPSNAPQVTQTVPAAGAANVNGGVVVKADFSRALDPTTVTTSSVTLTGPAGPVAGAVAYNSTAQEITLTPNAALASGTYTARLASTITASDGSPLGSDYTWSFTVPTTGVPLTVTSTNPAAGATAIQRDGSVTVTFSRALDATTVTTSSVKLLAPGGTVVPASVTYDATSKTATLTPSSVLAATTTYTGDVTTAVHADDGTPLANETTWTFTTAACPCSMMPTLTPTSTGNPTSDGRSGTGPFTLELGTKFTVDSALQLTAIRYYKSPGETGTHVGTIWTASGTNLGSVTFANETASGWQQQALASPIALQPNTVYVVSVGANAFFVVTPSGLATSLGSGLVHSVADGANGVFAMTAGTFPTQSYSSGNYFVDVVVR